MYLTWFNAGVQRERDNVLLWQQCDVDVASAESLDEERLALVGCVQHRVVPGVRQQVVINVEHSSRLGVHCP